ncbi:MAG: arylsulfatase [Planctomycetaceae bacterium]|nr:arylsulfatase [Planctomycetaceae bacterium]
MTRTPVAATLLLMFAVPSHAADRPNVVLLITDDQGYGDIGAHGNTMLKTPTLDRLHGQSVRLTDFHVDPTCSPTRSALMTGRYSTRTGVWHTIAGRSLMDPGEITLAEVFAANGYATGQFGKWHLGDNYPLRPQDQGFARTLHHRGGGITQSPDFWGNDYFDDTYWGEDGAPHPATGYCTDVWFAAAQEFIREHRDGPFLCYVATNAPHSPYFVAESYRQPYLAAGVSEPMASFYGMIANFDENLARLLATLDELQIADNTLLIYMTDNGSAAGWAPNGPAGAWTGFNAGMRDRKASEYDGGHRVPFFVRWPTGGIGGGRDEDLLAAHIDVLPTLVELCGLTSPPHRAWDGVSLASVLRGDDGGPSARTLFVHSQRLERPEKWRKCAVLTEQWRLVNGVELYDVVPDRGQKTDVASSHPDVVSTLRSAYDRWWESLEPVFDDEVRIGLGHASANPTLLCCHDWHGEPIPVNQDTVAKDPAQNGYWSVDVREAGRYEFRLRSRPPGTIQPIDATTATLRLGDVERTIAVPSGADEAVVSVDLTAGPAHLATEISGGSRPARGAYYVEVRRVSE